MSTGLTNANAGVNIYLALRDKDFVSGLSGASARLSAFAQRCQGLSQQIGIVAQSINVGFVAAVKQFAAFDDQMRMVAGVTGSAGAEFENLTQLAQKLGRETSFSAAQVAGGMVGLGRMGFDSGEIKDSIKSVMDLSRATGTDLVQASEIAGNALRVFGLRTSETGTVADLLATVSNRSAQTLADVGEALKTAGPHAARAGESLQDTAAAIGVLANMGIRGSMAGNAIGRTLKQIADPQVAAKLAEMGVATTGADGNLRKLKDILVDVARVSSTMKSGEQIAFFEDIFNARGSLAGGTLAANLPAIERMNEALANSRGAAASLAKEMDKGIGGSLRALSSAAEGVVNNLGERLSPAFSSAAQAISAVFNASVSADRALGGWGTRVAAIAVGVPSAFGGVATAAGLLSRAVAGLRRSWVSLAQTLGKGAAALTNPWVLGITAIAAAAAALYMAVRKSRQELRELVESSKELREKAPEAIAEGNARRATDLAAFEAANAGGADPAAAAEIRKRLAERYGDAAVGDASGAALRDAMLQEAKAEVDAQIDALWSRWKELSARAVRAGGDKDAQAEMELIDQQLKKLTARWNAVNSGIARNDISIAIEGQAKSMEELAEAARTTAEAIAKAKAAMDDMLTAETERGKSPLRRELDEIAAGYKAYKEQWSVAGEGDLIGYRNMMSARIQDVYRRDRAGYVGFIEEADAERDRKAAVSRMESGFSGLLEGGDLRAAESFVSRLGGFVENWRNQYRDQYAKAIRADSEDGTLLSQNERSVLDKLKAAITAGMERVADYRNRIAEARAAAAGSGEIVRRSVGTYRADAYFRNAGLLTGRDPAAERTAKATEDIRRSAAELLRVINNGGPLVLS